jgi:HAD superfamily hydrolase (TIGR01549 family)
LTVKAVIFDLDGTLADFNLDYMAVRAEVRDFLIREGIPASVLAINESIFEMLKKTQIYLRNTRKSDRKIDQVRNKALDIAEQRELEAAKDTGLTPGATDTMRTLARMGLKLGLCTINSEKAVNLILKRFRIVDYFDAVVPRNRVKQVKPNVEHLQATLKALKVDPDEAMIVGDGSVDMRCASEFGVLAVGIPTKQASADELMRAGANYVVTSITDLPSLVEDINSEQAA